MRIASPALIRSIAIIACVLCLLALIPMLVLAYAAVGWLTVEWPYRASPIAMIVAAPSLAIGTYFNGRAAVGAKRPTFWLGISLTLLSCSLVGIAAKWGGRMLG